MKIFAAGLLAMSLNAFALEPIEGVYKHRWKSELVGGETVNVEDVIEVVRYDEHAIYVRAALNFTNGHTCGIFGIAKEKGGVYHYEAPAREAGEAPCHLTVEVNGKDLRLDDGANTCQYNCGARGSFHDVRMPMKARRTIRYMDRLKNSEQYKASVAAYQK